MIFTPFMSNKNLQPLQNHIDQFMGKLEKTHLGLEAKLIKHWPSIIGEHLKNYVVIHKISFRGKMKKKGRLTLKVPPKLHFMLGYETQTILKNVNDFLKNDVFSEVFFIKKEQKKEIFEEELPKKMLSDDTLKKIESHTNNIENEALKEVLTRFYKSIEERS